VAADLQTPRCGWLLADGQPQQRATQETAAHRKGCRRHHPNTNQQVRSLLMKASPQVRHHGPGTPLVAKRLAGGHSVCLSADAPGIFGQAASLGGIDGYVRRW
jgi:hypothetical protein